MFTIEIVEKKTDRTARVALPASKFVVNDFMDRAHISGETMPRIYECTNVPELKDAEFTEPPTLEELNFLAKRIKEIGKDPAQLCAYRALLKHPFDTINEAINRTFNLESIPVIPCKNAKEYGEIVLENCMLEELEDFPEELDHLLDLEKIGKLMQEHENGIFIDGYYIATDSYDPVLVYDDKLPEQMEDWVFRIEVAGVPAKPEDINKMKREILTLPSDEEHMRENAEAVGEKDISYCNSMKFKSAILWLQDRCFESMEDVYDLNAIARKYSEVSREQEAKFKAVLEHERPRDLQGVDYLMSVLDEYEFDSSVIYPAEFGKKYLSKFLPEDFDRSLLESTNFDNLGKSLICENGCDYNDYGFISERGGHLYTMVKAPEQEPHNNLEMGGIS